MAKEVIRAVEVVIVGGNDPILWKQLEAAREAAYCTSDKRRAVVNELDEPLGYWRRWKSSEARLRKRGLGHLSDAALHEERFSDLLRRAHEALVRIEPRFNATTPDAIRSLIVTRRREAIGVATKLSRACGAFGDRTRTGANVRQGFSKACKPPKRAPRPRKNAPTM
jgi:hypothetical protein